MKVMDIALKDLLRNFRSALAVGMMFVVPLLVTALIYAAFGGSLNASENQEYSLPVVRIQVLNQDQGDSTSGLNAGKMLVDLLQDEQMQDIFEVTMVEDEASARAAVDAKEAAAALIIPPDFSKAAVAGTAKTQAAIYQDPTLSFGPGLLREVVDQFMDGFSGGRIAATVQREQFAAQGLTLDAAAEQQTMSGYGLWLQSLSSENGLGLPVDVRLPNQPEVQVSNGPDQRTAFLGPVMVGMMIFFVYFGATVTAQLIIKEQEEGTLARMFTTPTPLAVVLGGKFAAVFLTLIIQSIVLVIASSLVFGIRWGNPLSVLLVIVGLVVSAAGFGILLMSFVKTTRQAGPVTGGVLTLTGMFGGLMTTGMPSVPPFFEMTSKMLPQGWAMNGFRLVLSGTAPQDVLLPLAVMLAFGIIFFAIGARLFRSRFA